jgi:DNA-binding NtrC family response regulator
MAPQPIAAPPAGSGLELAVFSDDAQVTHALPLRGRVTVGRAEENDVCIPHPSVSRRHAVVHLGPPIVLEDLGGANGTSVREPARAAKDGETLGVKQLSGQSVEIAPGDSMTLGTVLVVLRRGAARSRGEAPRASVLPPGPEVVIRAPAMLALYEQASLAARGLISVLLLGETGAGKEVLARVVHERSPRAHRPFLGLNCAALGGSLLEGELFGHEKGAFTGAHESRPGLFEAAEGGTVFLDEVGELPLDVQAKLLRVIEERKVLRVGGRAPRAVDVRFVSATNRDLEAEVARGAFRQDLYFRLTGMTLTVPPLRERVAEIEGLAHVFLAAAAAQLDRPRPLLLSEQALGLLERHLWPGNVRELRNVVDRAAVLCTGDVVLPDHLPSRLRGEGAPAFVTAAPPAPAASAGSVPPVAAPAARRAEASLGERERIVATLEACAGNQTQAAARLGISRQTLIARIDAYGLPRPRKRG